MDESDCQKDARLPLAWSWIISRGRQGEMVTVLTATTRLAWEAIA